MKDGKIDVDYVDKAIERVRHLFETRKDLSPKVKESLKRPYKPHRFAQ